MLSFTRDACPIKYGAICYFVDFSYFCSVVWIVGAVFALVSRPGWLKWHVYKRAKGILSKYIAGGAGSYKSEYGKSCKLFCILYIFWKPLYLF